MRSGNIDTGGNLVGKKIKAISIRLVVIFALSLISLYVSSGSPSLHLSSQGAMESCLSGEDNVLFDLESYSLRVFVAFNNDIHEPKVYALVKRFGLWLCDFPSRRNIQGITSVGDDVYIYFLDKPTKTSYLQTEEGEKIEPLVAKKISDVHAVYIFKVEKYASKLGNYLLVMEDNEGNVLNVKTPGSHLEKISLSFLRQGEDDGKVMDLTAHEMGTFGDKKDELIDVFLSTIENRSPIEAVVFEGNKTPSIQKDIVASTTLGTYYKVEGKHKVYRWDHRVYYHLILSGQYKDVLVRSESSYLNKSLFDDGISNEVSYYKVRSSKEISEIYDLFFDDSISI
jgi:hypothetical protein